MPPATMLTGSLVAIVTPMRPGGALDLDGLRSLIDWHVAQGTAGIVIVGTAGDRADDTIRGIGRTAAQRAARVAIKETRGYLRGRESHDMIAVLRATHWTIAEDVRE